MNVVGLEHYMSISKCNIKKIGIPLECSNQAGSSIIAIQLPDDYKQEMTNQIDEFPKSLRLSFNFTNSY